MQAAVSEQRHFFKALRFESALANENLGAFLNWRIYRLERNTRSIENPLTQ
jgi:hypothetical protein